jgi:hypothetical protein
MTIKRLDHGSVVVDLAAAIAFFAALGMTLEGEAAIEGSWVDRINALERVQVDIVLMRRDASRILTRAAGHLATRVRVKGWRLTDHTTSPLARETLQARTVEQ